jgi:hypothetical protein
LQNIKLRIFKGFLEWFECKISNLVRNLLQSFDVFYPQKDKLFWTMEVASLWEKIAWWAKFSKNWSKKKVTFAPWMEEGTQNLLTQIGSCGAL